MTQLSIVFLGTGGSWPTVKRNVSSIAIKRGSEIILVDCGEGTQRQFQKSNLSYMQISKVFITHFHGDHFLGLPGIIQTMQLNDRDKPLHIYGPKGMKQLLSQLVSLGYFKPGYMIVAHELDGGNTLKFDGYDIHVSRVKHQAAEIAKKAQVERLFLTHISPRYLDHRVLENEARKIFKHSFVPKDFQEVEVKLKK